MEFVNTFEKHKAEPDVSVDRYIRERCIQLSKSVLTHKIVYLDTKFWISIRDASLGRSENKIEKDFYKKVMELAESDKCIFPISWDIFLEVIKQKDELTFHQTVKLIDFLSKGVSLIGKEERILLEIRHFMYSLVGIEVYKCRELAWTKLAYK